MYTRVVKSSFQTIAEIMYEKTSFIRTLGKVAFLVLAGVISTSAALGQESIKILMLGDEGHHRPSEFYRHLVSPLADAGIEVTYTQELSDINADNLSKYAGLMIFANIEKIEPAVETALLDYVSNGGGLIPVHCASYCFLNSDKYIELVGAQFKSHGFTRFETQVVDQNHEIMKGYKPFSAYDESYMHTRHNPDKIVLETRSSASGPVSNPAGEPYTWVRTSGNGRVFYTAWGHNYRTWEHPSFQDLLARGIRWACKKPVKYEQKHAPQLAVEKSEIDFATPSMIAPTFDEKKFTFTEVGAKIPNYTPGEKWGTQGELISKMQDPIPAEESITTYSFPEGFSMTLWAKEMDKYWPEGSQPKTAYSGLGGKPIAMTWDERGRLWVCETTDYPNNLESRGRGADRIRICEDTDNDGKADKFTVFAEKLSIPTTLVCYRGGVIVQDGQTTVYLKDIDGDDKADFRQELITGWALGDTHGGVSNLQYGPDNWIWGMQGYNNSQPVINGKTQQKFRQGFWRFSVDAGVSDETAPAFALNETSGEAETKASAKFNDHTIRVKALEFLRATNNNTWGLGFSEEGYVFGSTANACPSVHMAIPNRYYDNVAGWSPKTLEQISDNYYFDALDKNIRQVDQHGGYTAAAGHAVYTARNYPQSWWNRIGLVTEPTGHLVGSFVLQRRGAGYQSYDAFNTVASVDDWAAPIMAEIGPDGNVWVLDWYNYIVQHNPVPNGFQNGRGNAYESDLRDKRFGRVFRVHYGDINPKSSTNSLANAKPAELVAALSDSNMFWRKTAQRLIIEKNYSDEATLKQLSALVANAKVDEIGLNTAAIHALWTLSGLANKQISAAVAQALTAACEQGFAHPSGPVRHAAVMNCPTASLAKAVELGLNRDVDAKVQLAVLLRIADGDSKSIASDSIASLAVGTDSVVQDDILLDAWTAAAATQPIDVLVALASDDTDSSAELLKRVAILSEHVARRNPTAADIEKLLAMKADSPIAVSVWQGLAKGWPRTFKVELSDASQAKLRERFLGESVNMQTKAAVLAMAENLGVKNLNDIVEKIQTELFDVTEDSSQADSKRIEAWKQAIALAPQSPAIIEAIDELLTPQLPGSVAEPAIIALREARADGLAEALLAKRSKLTPRLSSLVLTTLLSRTETTKELLQVMSKGQVQFTDLQLDQRQALLSHPNKEIASLATEISKATGSAVTSNRQGLVNDWMSVTKMDGNVNNGIAMFKKHCALCHVHGDMGASVGPNLTGMAVHPKEELLVHILDPSRSVEGNFRTYQILTAEGNVFTGMLAGESQNSLRLIDSLGKEHQILREDIDEMNASTKSLMPEGFESLMNKQEFSDLLTFLTNRGRFTPVPLTNVATISSGQGLFYNRDNAAERIMFADWSPKKVGEVPFIVEDPQGGKRANIIMLQSPIGEVSAGLPTQVTLPVGGNVSAIHLLGGIAGWGYPAIRSDTVSLIVRCQYADGTHVDHPLRNSKEIADYVSKIDVPGSQYAFDASGRQVRYLKIPIDGSKPLAWIEFVKGDDRTAPIVLGVTIESENAAH